MKNSVYIIAEIGVNHNGSITLAKKLIKQLSKLDINAVKIQSYSTDNLVSKKSILADYQKDGNFEYSNQYEMLKKYELSKKQIIKLSKFSKECGISFMSSVFSIQDFKKLSSLSKKIIKIPSGEFTNHELIDFSLNNYKELILSTGLSDLKEVDDVVAKLKKKRKNLEGITLMHSTSAYPCPENQVDIKSVTTIKNRYNVKVGYSDHTTSSIASVMAVSLGATVIEKHVTLDKGLKGPDHKASLDILEFTSFVNEIRHAELMLGNGKKNIQSDAQKIKKVVKKSIYSTKAIKKGEKFTLENVKLLRPAGGLDPSNLNRLIKKRAKKDYQENQIISNNEII